MELPVQKTPGEGPRSADEVRAMAVAVQANLVTLEVAETKRRGGSPAKHAIAVPPPGFVRHFRETLIAPGTIATYSDLQLYMRLRQVWGQYCLMLWLFEIGDPPEQTSVAEAALQKDVRCGPVLGIKHDEIHALLWCLRFVQRKRDDTDYVRSAGYQDDLAWAKRIPASALPIQPDTCSDGELLLAVCEYVGMLATLRWAMDSRSRWDDEQLMAVAEKPF